MTKKLYLLFSLCLLAVIGISSLSLSFFSMHPVRAAGQTSNAPVSGSHGRTLVLVGGALANNNSEIYGKIIAQAGGKGIARIGIITAASIPESQDPHKDSPQAANSEDDALFYAKLFRQYGAADAEWLPIDTQHIYNNSSPALLGKIKHMTGFFFGGGDQERLLTCLYLNNPYDPNRVASPVLNAIAAKYDAGAVIAGTSAGTDAQVQEPMVTGGVSYDGIKYGAFPYMDLFDTYKLTYNPVGGFGRFTYGLLDTHFSQRGREGRSIRLASDTHTLMAYGIDQNTALFITNADTPNAQIQIIGQGGAYILDLSHASVKFVGKFWTIYGVKATYLTHGDSYNPVTKTATIASFKSPLAGHEHHKHAITTNDIFDSSRNGGNALPDAFTAISTYLFDSQSTSTYGTTFEQTPAFKVVMTKVQGSAGYEGTFRTTTYISYVNLNVDIVLA